MAKAKKNQDPEYFIGGLVDKVKKGAKKVAKGVKKGAKSVAKDVKKGLKGSKAHREKTKKLDEGKGGKNWYPGKFAKKAVKGAVKKGKEIVKDVKAKKAKKAADKSWSKAVKSQKKSGGESLSSLVSQRKNLKKGTAAYAEVQNKINKAYGVQKRHSVKAPYSPKVSKPAPTKTKDMEYGPLNPDDRPSPLKPASKGKPPTNYAKKAVNKAKKAVKGAVKKLKNVDTSKLATGPINRALRSEAPKFEIGGLTPDPASSPNQATGAVPPPEAAPEAQAQEAQAAPEAQASYGGGGQVDSTFGWPITDARSRGKS